MSAFPGPDRGQPLTAPDGGSRETTRVPVVRLGAVCPVPFLESFAAKGRFGDAMRKIPVHVVLAPDVALLGAAACVTRPA